MAEPCMVCIGAIVEAMASSLMLSRCLRSYTEHGAPIVVETGPPKPCDRRHLSLHFATDYAALCRLLLASARHLPSLSSLALHHCCTHAAGVAAAATEAGSEAAGRQAGAGPGDAAGGQPEEQQQAARLTRASAPGPELAAMALASATGLKHLLVQVRACVFNEQLAADGPDVHSNSAEGRH